MSREPISPALKAPVFHFTDTINLPWILASGELRPTWNGDTGIGRTRFLWGTTNPDGDLTSGPQIRIHGSTEREWRAGAFHLVRFTLRLTNSLPGTRLSRRRIGRRRKSRR